MDLQDQEKTVFNTKFGIYEFTIMSFSLINILVTFQHLIDKVLYNVTWKFILVYMETLLFTPDLWMNTLYILKRFFNC